MRVSDVIKKISRGTVEIINLEGLEAKLTRSLNEDKPLVVKAGFDPTAPDIHLGHTVLLNKLKLFQDLGHRVFFLIGDFTAQVGDPTGKDQIRRKMSVSEIEINSQTYKKQVFKILDPNKTEVVFNSHWLAKLSAQQILELSAHSTVAQMLARADFKKRFESGKEISLLEFIYPLLQGYDSVHLKADIELGGSDQKFNLLMGRQLQEAFNQQPQVVIMTPLLEGTDGVNKMSKSLGNYIGIQESSAEIFGKVMSVSDELMIRYYQILTDVDLNHVKQLHPKEAKLQLAQLLVRRFYSEEKAGEERINFESIFSQHQLPDEISEHKLKDNEDVLMILIVNKLAPSRNEARRLIQQKAISLDGEIVESENVRPKRGVLRVGKRRFLRIV
ncbi:MAG: tyrosine--tRNA ligase [Candidatus Omnitrophica bacterium]|nr:tyrosine--tRNA ligase [Candidatus Omnitrophota bacterium]